MNAKFSIQQQLHDALSAYYQDYGDHENKRRRIIKAIESGADVYLPPCGDQPNYSPEVWDKNNFNAIQHATYMMIKGSCWLFDYFDGKGYDLAQVARQFIRPRTFARDITSNSTSRILPYALLWWPEEYGNWRTWTDPETGQGLAHQFAAYNPNNFCTLAEMGMKIDGRDKHGNTPLHFAITPSCYEQIKKMQKDLHPLNNVGLTPFARYVFTNIPEQPPKDEAGRYNTAFELSVISRIMKVLNVWDEPQKVEIFQRLHGVMDREVRVRYEEVAEDQDSINEFKGQLMKFLACQRAQRLSKIAENFMPDEAYALSACKPKI